MPVYEATFVFPKGNNDMPKVIESYLKVSKAKVKKHDDWGVKALAYPINKQKDAHYMYYELEMETQDVKTLETKIKLDEVLLRHLIVRLK